MGDKSKIEWTEATWNPIAGCSKVSAGCQNCYAMRHAHRIAGSGNPAYKGTTKAVKGKGPQWTGQVNFLEERLSQPLRWKRPRLIFVNSMSDLFHPDVPFSFVDKVFAVMAIAKQHTFQILTKRPERMAEYLNSPGIAGVVAGDMLEMGHFERPDDLAARLPLPNVWLGTSVENQAAADERIPHLLRTPATVRFLSCEPLLAPVTFRWASWRDWERARDEGASQNHLGGLRLLDWVIVGGESGPGARPMHPDWARSIRDQCQEAGVAFHFKQWGAWSPGDGPRFIPNGTTRVRVGPPGEGGVSCYRVGKKAAGRELDGRTWDEMPGRVA